MGNINFEGAQVAASKTDTTLMQITVKAHSLSGSEVTDYTFSYRIKPGENEEQIKSFLKTDTEFKKRLESLIDLNKALQENLGGGYKDATLQQDDKGNVKIYRPIDPNQPTANTAPKELENLHQEIKQAISQQQNQNQPIAENLIKASTAINKYFQTFMLQNKVPGLVPGQLSMIGTKTHTSRPLPTPPNQPPTKQSITHPGNVNQRNNLPHVGCSCFVNSAFQIAAHSPYYSNLFDVDIPASDRHYQEKKELQRIGKDLIDLIQNKRPNKPEDKSNITKFIKIVEAIYGPLGNARTAYLIGTPTDPDRWNMGGDTKNLVDALEKIFTKSVDMRRLDITQLQKLNTPGNAEEWVIQTSPTESIPNTPIQISSAQTAEERRKQAEEANFQKELKKAEQSDIFRIEDRIEDSQGSPLAIEQLPKKIVINDNVYVLNVIVTTPKVVNQLGHSTCLIPSQNDSFVEFDDYTTATNKQPQVLEEKKWTVAYYVKQQPPGTHP